ncbi:MAG: hypothetical protein ACTSPY_05305 [Candidatus Helarchaeota archaeon]
MKNKYLVSLFLILAVCSGLLFTMPVPIANAEGLPGVPDLGDSERINFLDALLGGIFDNDTRGNFSSNLIFENTTAYFHLTYSGNYSYFEPSSYFYAMEYTGVKTSSDEKVYIECELNVSNLNINFIQNISLLMILWDNDKSFINFLAAVDNATKHGDQDAVDNLLWNALRSISTIFTGDEMLIVVPVFFWKFDINVDYNLTTYFIIDEDDDGPYDDPKYTFDNLPSDVKTQISQAANEDPSLEPLINSTGAQSINGSYASFFFMITEFWAKRIFWGLRLIPLMFTYDLDIVMASHRLMGAVLYNDSNNNGLMDVEFDWNDTAKYYYPVVDEAMFSIELVDAANCLFSAPVVDEDENTLSWNATLVNPTVRLNPWGVSSETGIILNTTEIPVEDTSFGFTFKPQAIASLNGQTIYLNAMLKLDHMIGNFNGSSGLMGKYKDLDLAVLYMTDIFELKAQNSFSKNTPETNSTMVSGGTPIDSYSISKTTSETETLDFFVGTSRVSGLDLAGANYSINDGDAKYEANGAVIPYAMYAHRYLETGELLDGQTGDVEADWSINTNFTRSIGAYIITYPDFNGSKILHDPVFSMFGSISPRGIIPGFEWVLVLPGLAIVAAVIIFFKKRQIKI